MTEKDQKATPGTVARAIGTGVAVLSLFVILTQIIGAADFMLWPWFGALIGLALVGVGYMQKVAARPSGTQSHLRD